MHQPAGSAASICRSRLGAERWRAPDTICWAHLSTQSDCRHALTETHPCCRSLRRRPRPLPAGCRWRPARSRPLRCPPSAGTGRQRARRRSVWRPKSSPTGSSGAPAAAERQEEGRKTMVAEMVCGVGAPPLAAAAAVASPGQHAASRRRRRRKAGVACNAGVRGGGRGGVRGLSPTSPAHRTALP